MRAAVHLFKVLSAGYISSVVFACLVRNAGKLLAFGVNIALDPTATSCLLA
jgi:hypothetical protein